MSQKALQKKGVKNAEEVCYILYESSFFKNSK